MTKLQALEGEMKKVSPEEPAQLHERFLERRAKNATVTSIKVLRPASWTSCSRTRWPIIAPVRAPKFETLREFLLLDALQLASVRNPEAEIMLDLSVMPCGALGYNNPGKVTLDLLGRQMKTNGGHTKGGYDKP